MRIRKTYYPIFYNDRTKPYPIIVEEYIQNYFIGWILTPYWKKCLIKWHSNLMISLCRKCYKLTRFIVTSSFKSGVFDARVNFLIQRKLPISLTTNDVIKALHNGYKEETGIDVIFSKELEKSLNSKEKEEIKQNSKKDLKEKHLYLLELANKLRA